jgi:hypothetical protein
VSKWTEAANGELEDLYEQVPDVSCKGLCADSCGPIDMGAAERLRFKQAGLKIPSRDQGIELLTASGGEWHCPALTDRGSCSAYQIRPMICRIWGATEDLPCPYGCRPAAGENLLPPSRAYALLDAARKAGTALFRIPEEDFRAAAESPEGQEVIKRVIRAPVRNRKRSRRLRGT